ncbi:TPA: hypothetical protein DIV49_03050 [Candidatus Saccharibacteria bacterium]|nr:hypothetical protein [Candidatus Saccharibacteria bacterium]HRJ90690.1 transglycosylase domain-containing protein [Candidatus Saccharibacteria bacterium]
MYRQGKYTKKRGPVRGLKSTFKHQIAWWKRLGWKKQVLLVSTPILAFLIITPIATYLYFARDIDDQERLMNRNNTGVEIVDRKGKQIYSFGRSKHHDIVKLKDISDNVEKAVIASEDKNFYEHSGFSLGNILGALYANFISGGNNYGGSTLTQQLAKNTVLTDQRTFLRKYQELSVALAIEQRYSKDEILEMYLNSVYFGEGAFGIKDAAKTYFNKSQKNLTVGESAMLIGILPSPTNYSPISGVKEYAYERQNTVLTRMVKNGKITEAQKQVALKQKLHYAPKRDPIDNGAPHFTGMVLSELYEKYGEEKVNRSGYRVVTTLDLGMQKKANAAVQSNMAFIQANNGTNASLVAIDPKSGEIRALVGSADYNNPKWGMVNMVTTPRQPGSSFKPIYYSEALARGLVTPATVLQDVPTDFGGYTPQNASRTFSGPISVRNALSRSLNIPSIKVMQKLGVDNAITTAKKMGITTLNRSASDYGLPLALGSGEIPLEEMTNAYAGFANQGEHYNTSIIDKIDNKFDETIFTEDKTSERGVSEQGAFLISNILSDNNARAPIFGSSLTVSGHTVAVKTGTTDDAKDAWTIGYTPSIAAGVWVGNNDNVAMYNGGSSMAGPIWRSFMQSVLDGTSNEAFKQPAGIVKLLVCSNGKKADRAGTGTFNEYFLASAQPKESCNVPDKKKDKPKKDEETAMCTVVGKEDLTADDENCVVDMCSVPGKEDLAANDPNCVEGDDADSDGVTDDIDQCPNTAVGATVNAVGCSEDQL